MDWKITKTKNDGIEVLVTITATMPLEEYAKFRETNEMGASGKVVKKSKAKKEKPKKKGKPKDFDKKAYMKAYHAKKRAEKKAAKEAAESSADEDTDEDEDKDGNENGEPSQEKQDRMEALDKQIKSAQEEQEQIYGRERP